MPTRRRLNPVTGYHPDLLPREHRWPGREAPAGARYKDERDIAGATPIFVPLADLTPEEIEALPVQAFTPDEWAQLDEHVQDEIVANDASSKERIQEFADLFTAQWRMARDPSRSHYLEIEDSFETWLADQGAELWRSMPLGRVRALVSYASELGLDVRLQRSGAAGNEWHLLGANGYDVLVAINEAMENSNRYRVESSNQTNAVDADPVFTERLMGSLYLERIDYRKLYDAMAEFEIERALALVEEETNGDIEIDRTRFEKNLPIEAEWDTGITLQMSADWERIEREVRAAIDEFAPDMGAEGYEALAAAPPQARVVHRWPDGFYVQDLLAEELPAEGEAMGMCVGRPEMGYADAVRLGKIKILSLRRPSGKPLFTFELEMGPRGAVREIVQIKGKANRLPGFDRGHTDRPIKRDEVERVLEFVEGPLVEYTRGQGRRTDEGIAFEDVADLRDAAKQVWKLFAQGDPWARRLLLDKLKLERARHRVPHELPPPATENPARSCKLHGARCGGFCAPYRPRR